MVLSSWFFGDVWLLCRKHRRVSLRRFSSPYACGKLFDHWQTINYRESYKLFACNGTLFNHESPRRGETFDVLELDWREYVVVDEQLLRPTDSSISRGQPRKVREVLGWEAKYKMIDIIKAMIQSR